VIKNQYYLFRYRLIAIINENIVTTLRRQTQIAERVASKTTGCVDPSDKRAIIAIESKATIKWA
jgi:hypothetical protein